MNTKSTFAVQIIIYVFIYMSALHYNERTWDTRWRDSYAATAPLLRGRSNCKHSWVYYWM